jgi:hypothetical protein
MKKSSETEVSELLSYPKVALLLLAPSCDCGKTESESGHRCWFWNHGDVESVNSVVGVYHVQLRGLS